MLFQRCLLALLASRLNKVERSTVEPSSRFVVNLSASKDTNASDIPLHMSVRMDEDAVVFNSHIDGVWGNEQRIANPFKLHAQFKVRIIARDHKYEIFVNENEVATFEYRLPLARVEYVCISGEVELQRLCLEGPCYAMPFQTTLSDGFGKGKRVYISGFVKAGADRFTINLLTRNGDKALHFNPRFDEMQVVRNHESGGHWGSVEERDGGFPFQPAQQFDVVVESQPDVFCVYVDGKAFCKYTHRLAVADIHAVMIEGDVEVQAVNS